MSGLRSFDGAVAIVTGGASGIGRALSQELCRRGAQVVVADIDGDDADALAAQLRAAGHRATSRRVDVTDFGDVEALVAEAVSQHGRIDYYFNNAGIGAGGEVADYSREAWDRVIAVNVSGVAYGVQCVYPVMLKQGFGHIVNTASMAGLLASPGLGSYTLSKHAVVGLTKSLRAEGHARGVRVSAFCPGVIRTPILEGGRHGVMLPHIPEAEQRRLFKELFEQLRPLDPAVFARRALDQVARNVPIIIVPGWWRVLWWMERWCPALAWYLVRTTFEGNRTRLQSQAGAAGVAK
jgi:NAD(P)-dependent dehydrogenase (short-subunit alcohol dehydrogenase family)